MTKDRIVRGLIADGTVKFMAIDAKEMVTKAVELHKLSRVCTAALGRTLMMTSMMSAQLKAKTDRITCIIKGGGPAGNIVCTGREGGVVKGYIENPELELPLAQNGKLDVSMAVGWFGELVVIKDLGLKEPYIGRSEMVSGEIAEDFAQYYMVSEQQPSIVYLGVRVNAANGDVLSAAGLLVQPLPDCPKEVIDVLQQSVYKVSQLSLMIAQGRSLEDATSGLFSDLGVTFTETVYPAFECDCTRERIERVLIAMGEEELRDMITKDRGAELKCDFCSSFYRFTDRELSDLLALSRACPGSKTDLGGTDD